MKTVTLEVIGTMESRHIQEKKDAHGNVVELVPSATRYYLTVRYPTGTEHIAEVSPAAYDEYIKIAV